MKSKRRKFTRGLGWSLLAILGLLVVAVLVVELMSWNFLKPTIKDRVEAATGRSLSIDGDVSVSLFPRPHASVSDLALENPDWADAPNMAEVASIRVTPSVSDLLTGQLVLDEVEIEQPIVNLERSEDGAVNWTFESTTPTKKDEKDGEPPLSVRKLDVSDARVRYQGPEIEDPLELSIPSLEMQDDGESLQAQATMQLQGREFRLNADATSMDAYWSEDTSFRGDVSLASADANFDATFALPWAASLERLQAEWELAVQDLGGWSEWAGGPEVGFEALDFAGRLEREEGEWRFDAIEAKLDQTRINGEMIVDTESDPISVTGRLHSPELDLVALSDDLPPPDELSEPSEAAIPEFPALRGELTVSVDRLIFEQGLAENLQADLALVDRTLSVDTFGFDIGNGAVDGSASLTSAPDALMGEAELAVEGVEVAELELVEGFGGVIDGDFALALERLERGAASEPSAFLDRLRIDRAQLAYTEESVGTDLQAELELSAERSIPTLAVNGRFRGQPVEIAVEADALPGLLAEDQEYAITGRAASGDMSARFATTLGSIRGPEELTAGLELSGEGGDDLEAWLDQDLPDLPEYHFSARVTRDGPVWAASEVEAEIGESSLTGELRFQNVERPVLEADLHADRIDLSALLPKVEKAVHQPQIETPSPEDETNLSALRAFDGRLAFQADTIVLPDGQEVQDLALNATLESGQARLESAEFRIAGGSVAASAALDASEDPASGNVEVAFDQIDLGEFGDTFLAVQDRVGMLSGSLDMSITQTRAGELRDDVLLPFIGRVTFEPSHLQFMDPKFDTEVTLRIETRGLEQGEQALHVDGEGRYDGAPFSLRFRGDPVMDARDPLRPYFLGLEAKAVDTEIEVSGTVLRPLALKELNLELALNGPNPQRLSRLLGVPLPLLPPYSISGDLSLEDGDWAFSDLEGRVGDSDLSGYLTFDAGVLPPRIKGELYSESLDIDDLGGLVGATPAAEEDETVSERQARLAEERADERFVLPDEPVIGEALEKISADIHYRGRSVRVGGVPLTDLVIDFALEKGHVRFEPVGFGVGQGRVDFTLDLNAREQPPKGNLNFELRGVNLREALSEWGLASESVGTLAGRGKFWVEGASVAEVLASADGGMVLLMTEGRLDDLLVELAGLDAGEAFLSLIQDRGRVRIYCAYADVQVRDGLARLDTFVVDTSDTTFTAGGTVDFNDESLDVTLAAHPKDPSVFVGRTPLHLGGTFADITPGVHGGKLAARVTGSAALAAVGGPVAALLPLLEAGTGEDLALCEGLIRRTRKAMKKEGDEQ